MEKKDYILSSGVLFLLLSDIKRVSSQSQLMKNLSNAIAGKNQYWGKDIKTLRTRTSKCINCQESAAFYFPNNSNQIIDMFVKKVVTDFSAVQNQMIDFIKDSLEKEKLKKLIRNIIFVIENDQTIAEDQAFYINSDGTSVTKQNLRKLELFSASSFLVGTIHFILENRKSDNLKGRPTIEEISTIDSNRRSLKIDFPQDAWQDFNVYLEESIDKKIDNSSNRTPNPVTNSSTYAHNNGCSGNKHKNTFKKLHYKSQSVNNKENTLIFDDSYTIIDLNKMPLEFDSEYSNTNIIFKFQTVYKLTATYNKLNERVICVSTDLNNKKFKGITIKKNWVESLINRRIDLGCIKTTALFRIEDFENDTYYVHFLIIGDENYEN